MKRIIIGGIITSLAFLGFSTFTSHADVPNSTDGTITACRNENHAVRIIDTENSESCNGSEEEITWTAQGGAVLFDSETGTVATLGGVNVVTVNNVPAGKYTVTAKTKIQNTSASSNFVQCGLTGLGYSESSSSSVVGNGWTTLYVQGVVELSSATNIELFCNPSLSASATQASLIITRIDSVN